ncbi:sodium channel protein Nach-like [Rhagoletis pomonella]|uniref:sodium channel protein Nach-like n=1 Tax=Rhagoletis pomonella TaxID=28610 RepID=UPI00177EAEE7|nr:sodium channel protein Nach-like [Rhagoletis pomonella]
MHLRRLVEEYFENSTLHGAKFIVDKDASWIERLFWALCLVASWIASWQLIKVSLDAFENNAISFVVESSYRDWDTNFPAIVVCESKNMDRIQEVAEKLWGADHDFTLEEVLSEISFFRGESYHMVHECGGEEPVENCFYSNFSYYAQLVRSSCQDSIQNCMWHDKAFECCKYFQRMETELGICYAINSLQAGKNDGPKLNMYSNRYTGPGSLKMELHTEATIFILGEEEVPTLVTPKTDYLLVGPYVSFVRHFSKRDIQNDEQIRETSVAQRNCRFSDENNLDVHRYYSYSACTVQCRKDRQIELCNCSSHLSPNTPDWQLCNMDGLECLNRNYEDLSVIIAKWSRGRKGLVCDCLPSCTEVDISTVHDSKENIFENQNPLAKVEISLIELPTERYKRNVVRGKLDLVVSIGGTTGLFVGASLLSFVEIIYYITIRPYGTMLAEKRQMRKQLQAS